MTLQVLRAGFRGMWGGPFGSARRAGKARPTACTLIAFLAAVSVQIVNAAQAPTAGNVTNGAAAFAKVGCEACHGAQGRGSASGPSLAASALPIKDFIAYVRKPTGTMPPQSVQVVPDATLVDIYAFVHQRQAGQAPAAQGSAAPPPGRVEAGAKLYGTVGCYQCHSNEGQGGGTGTAHRAKPRAVGPVLELPSQADRRHAAVHRGRALGPGHGRHLRVSRRAAAAAGPQQHSVAGELKPPVIQTLEILFF